MKWGLKPKLFTGAVVNNILARLPRAGISSQEAVLHERPNRAEGDFPLLNDEAEDPLGRQKGNGILLTG
jgi:hypothetical protein